MSTSIRPRKIWYLYRVKFYDFYGQFVGGWDKAVPRQEDLPTQAREWMEINANLRPKRWTYRFLGCQEPIPFKER